MKLSNVFKALGSAELANLNLVENGYIKPEKMCQVLQAVNLGLIDLYTRFLLKKKIHKETLAIGEYQLNIADKDLIEVLKVFNNGHELNHYGGYSLMAYNALCMNINTTHPNEVLVQYKAKHPELTNDDIVNDVEIELPPSHLKALLYFIASRQFVSIPNQLDGDLNEGMRYTNLYIQEITMLKDEGIDTDGLDEDRQFYQRGFV